MIPKYSNEVYEIIKVNKNNVTVLDNGRNKIIKNDNLNIVDNIENPILQAQKTANIQHITIITGKYLIIFLFLFKALYLLFFHLI